MNEAEKEVAWHLGHYNVFAISKGWPDFLCYDEERGFPFCVEVKAHKDVVQPHQALVHDILRRGGIPVIVIWIDVPGWNERLKKDLDAAHKKWFTGEEKGVWNSGLRYSSQTFRVPPQSCIKTTGKRQQWVINFKQFLKNCFKRVISYLSFKN